VERITCSRYYLAIVFAACLAAGCSHNTNPPAGQTDSPLVPTPSINIVGSWSGTIGRDPITYVFNADGTSSVITQQQAGTSSTKGTYSLAGNKLTVHTDTLEAMGQTIHSGDTAYHTIALSGNQLTLQDMGLVLTRQTTASIPPPQPPQPAQAPVPGSSVQTMQNGQQYIKGPTTVQSYPNGAPSLVPPPPAGPHTIAPPAPPQDGSGGATH
jgi:hypothetical protein